MHTPAILKRVLLLFAFTCPLLAQPMLQLTPNSGRAGTTVDVAANAPLDPAGRVTFDPPGLVVSNLKRSGNGVQFRLTIPPAAAPGPYTLVYQPPEGMRSTTFRQPNAFTVLPAQQAEGPVVRQVLPPTVTAGAPAVELRITGANFQQGLRVDAGRGVNPTVTRVTPTLIVGTISAGKTTSAGPRQVIVTNPDGASNAREPGQLTVIVGTQQPPAAQPPRARQVTPATITAGTMVPVVITGENFQQALRIALGNGVTATVKSVTPTQISAAFGAEPNAAPGVRSVVVTNPDGLSDPSPPQINVLAAQRPPEMPRIDRVTPSTFTAGTTTPVTLAGANFKTGATLTIGDGVTANVTSVTPTQISATFVTAPNAAPGPRNVVVRNPDGASNANQPPPRITIEAPAPQLPRVRSVTPRTIAAGTTIPVTISGENFRPGAKVTFAGPGLRFTPGAINGNTIGGTLTADPNATAGPRAVTVTNPDGASSPADPGAQITVTTPDRPTEPPTQPPTQPPTKPPTQQPPPVKPINPVIVSIAPPSVTPGQTGVTVSIIGSGFQQGANVNISGSGITLRNARVDSATVISATIDVARNAEAGPRGVVVRNPDGSSTAAQQPQPRIMVVVPTPEPPRPDPRLAPRVDLVTPRTIDPGAQVTLTLQGANFAPGMNISLGRDVLIVGAPVVRSPREATVTVLAAPAVSAGMRTVAASSAAGSSSGPGSVLINSAAPPAAATPVKTTRPDKPVLIDVGLPKRPLPKGEIILDGPLDPESLRCTSSSATECLPEVLTLDTVFTWHETNPGIADYFRLEIIDPYGKVLVSAQTRQRHYRMTGALMAALPLLDPGNVRKSGTPRRPKKNATGSGMLIKGFTPPPLDRLGVSEEERSNVKLVSSKPLMPGGGIGAGLSAGMGAYIEEISVAAAWQDRPGVAYWRVIGYYDERDVSGKRSGNFVPVEESSEEGIILPFPPTGAANCDSAISSGNLKIDSRNLAKLPEQCDAPGKHCAGEDIMLSGTIDLSRVPFDVGSSMTSWPPKPVSAKRSGETIPSSVSFSNVFIDWGDGTEPERLSVASTSVASASSVSLTRLATYDNPRKGDIGLPLSHRYAREAPSGGYTIRIYSVSDPDRVPTYKVAEAGYKVAGGGLKVSNPSVEAARNVLGAPSTHLIACTKVNVIDAPGASEQDGLHLIAAAVEWPAPYDATPEPKVSGCAEALRPRVRIDYWGQGRVRVSWLINGDTTPLEQTELTLAGVSKASGEARKMPRIEELGVSLPLSASSSANTLIARVEVIEEAKPAPAPAPSGGGKTASPGGSLYGSKLSGSLYSFAEVNTIVKAGSGAAKTVTPDFMARLRLAPLDPVTSSQGPREISSAPKSYAVVPPKSGEVCRLVYPTTLGDFVITDVTNLEEKAGRHSGRGTLRVDFPTGSGATKAEYVPISFTNWQLGAYKAGERRVENGTADVTLSTTVNPLNFDVKFTRIRLSREISTVDGTVSLTSAQLPSIPGAKYPSFPFAGIPMNPSGELYFEYSTPVEVPLGFSGFNLRISKAAIDFSTAKGESSSATTCKETATGTAWTGVLVSGTLSAPDFSFGTAGKMLPDIPVEKWSFGPGGFSAELHRDLARNLSLAGGLAINVGKMDLVACNTSFDAKIGLKLTGVPLIEEPFSGEIQVTTSKGILAKFGGTAIKKDWTVVQLNIGRADFKYDSSIGDWAVSFDADATLKLPNGFEVYKHEFAGFKVTLDGKLASPGGSDWVAAGDTGPASLGGFPLQVTKIGAGLRAGGGVWFGISAAVQFANVLKAEGSDIRFKLDRASGGGYRMAGVDVGELKINFSYPDGSPTVKAHATIGWQMEGSTYRFAGQGGLSIAGTIGIEAAFLYGRDPSVGSYWLARAAVEFPGPIVFAPTPLGLFGVGGGLAYNVPLDSLKPHKKITDVRPSAGSGYLFSATVDVGTAGDNGFTVYAKGTLTIATGKGVRIDVAAWLLTRERGEPHANGCIQYAGGSFDAGFGVKYKFAGDQIVVNAETGSDACKTAAVNLHFGSDGWHVWLGNESNPIEVKVIVFAGKGYLMADNTGIRTSVTSGFHLRYSGDIAGVGGFVEVGGNSTVGLRVGFEPFVIGGNYGAAVTGRAGVRALGKDWGIGISAGVDIAVSLPPFRACGTVHVSVDLGFKSVGGDVSACI